MLLFNPGGPGGSGILFLIQSAPELVNATLGGNWDQVSCMY